MQIAHSSLWRQQKKQIIVIIKCIADFKRIECIISQFEPHFIVLYSTQRFYYLENVVDFGNQCGA